MSELGSQRPKVLKVLKPLHAIPVENSAKPGTPDVNYREGWIELKWLRQWPVRDDTVVKIEHYTLIQRRFGRDRWARGGHSWLLLQVRRDWLLFTGPVAHDCVGLLNKRDLCEQAHRHWTAGLPREELIECLTMDLGNWSGYQALRPCLLSEDD